ncbi:MAG: ATP-dependent RecD-like DNA helicase [Lentisphaeria bacterium]|nr:ATP-dependent RecD-like DNA helicase [Lentisphaeria bacterium]
MEDLFHNVIRGEVLHFVFEKPDGSYSVLRLKDEADDREKIVVGPISGIGPGQCIEVSGRWDKHPEYGRQFKAASFRPVLPSTQDGIIRFLGSGSIPGIGAKTARLIVDTFGKETLTILEKFPTRIMDIPGIGKKKAAMIIKAWQESSALRDVYIFLQGLGISQTYCRKFYARYGAKAADVVRANPYKLAEDIDGIGFLKADAIAQELGISPDSPERMTAAAVFTMNKETGNGHVCLPMNYFIRAVSELAGQPENIAVQGIERAVFRKLIAIDREMAYAPQLLRAETTLPRVINELAAAEQFAGRRCLDDGRNSRMQFSSQQLLAVERIRQSPLCIITGGPGVGKTTVLGEIVRRAKKADLRIAAAAPTGKAAKRMEESTGLQAKTLHRLLVFDPATGRFGYDDANPLPCDLLIVDEVSMLDILLAQALFRAVKPGTSVLLVGDRDQLPSVGPGRVLNDLIASGKFLTTELTEVFRQSAGSRIIQNAHRINRGQMPERPPQDGQLSDFYWIEQEDPEKALQLVLKSVCERIPKRFRLNPMTDIQVLTPMNKGICGTAEMNTRLQELLNPGTKECIRSGERLFKQGDRVMQTSNNYDLQTFNGDQGIIERIDEKKKKFTVLFDGDRPVEYGFEDADQLTLSYAITVHKSQGCEFPAVVLPILSQHSIMLQRNLLYTAVTRAKKLLVLIGGRKAIYAAACNTRQAPRYSLLAERFLDTGKKY